MNISGCRFRPYHHSEFRHVESFRSQHPDPGPLFHMATYKQAHPESVYSRGGPLGHFIAHAGEQDLLPVPPGYPGPPPRWGETRRVLLDKARERAAHDRLRGALRPEGRAAWGAGCLALAGMEWSTNSSGNHLNVLGSSELAKVPRGEFRQLYDDFLPGGESHEALKTLMTFFGDDQFDFVELVNVGTEPIDLTAIELADALISWQSLAVIAPGAPSIGMERLREIRETMANKLADSTRPNRM